MSQENKKLPQIFFRFAAKIQHIFGTKMIFLYIIENFCECTFNIHTIFCCPITEYVNENCLRRILTMLTTETLEILIFLFMFSSFCTLTLSKTQFQRKILRKISQNIWVFFHRKIILKNMEDIIFCIFRVKFPVE